MFFFGVVLFVGVVFLIVRPITFLVALNLVVGTRGKNDVNAFLTPSFFTFPLDD